MIIELLGAKIIAPYFGTSLYVWASVLGVTLISLASGYFIGGRLSIKQNISLWLFWIIGIGGIFTLIAPITGQLFMQTFAELGVRSGSLCSVISYLFIPLTCMGIVSPLITQLINSNTYFAGRSAGTVFSISTLGGILATFLAGFYMIPELGIKNTAFINGGFLILMSIVGLLFYKRFQSIAVILAITTLISFASPKSKKVSGDYEIKYQSSGILGEWTILDRSEYVEYGEKPTFRSLLLNGISQTNSQIGYLPISTWSYPHKIAALAGIKPIGAKALLIGMGGGSISYNLKRLGFETDIVELDARIINIANKYFNFNQSDFNLTIDDGRHFINEVKKNMM